MTVKRYRMIDQIGQGGMGRVFRAVDRLSGQIVALKQVTISNTDAAELRLSLAQEFKTLASLRHPHIISVLDYGFDSDRQPYFTMEFLDAARTLAQYGAACSERQKYEAIFQILQALAYLHRRGIIHRDLKPANVLVTTEGNAKVVDFGLAIPREYEDERVVGTLAYIAPETLQGAQPSQASDLYAVGLMAYELLSGRHPFDLSDSTLFIEQLLTSEPDLSVLDIKRDIVPIIGRLLARYPEGRYHDAAQVIDDLQRALQYSIELDTTLRESFLQAATFVGRRDELNTLHAALRDALAGHGSAWLVGGESGVGKSRLLDELRTLALVEGALMMRGQSVQSGGLPYRQWRDPMRRMVLDTPLSDLEAGVLQEIVPDIEDLIGRKIPPIQRLEGAPGQQRLIQTIIDLFKRQDQPMVVLLEDLQWASESLQPLKVLNQQLADLPILIVGTYRDDERPELPDELPDMQVVKLHRLSVSEIAALSQSMLGQAGENPNVVDLLQRETEGNTFFIVEVVRALAEDAGDLHKVGMVTLPGRVVAGGIQAVIRRRLRRVPDSARPLLNMAAVAGRQLDMAVMEHLKADTELETWLTICENAAILEVHEERWQFTHDKLREGLLSDIPDEDRPRINRRVAMAIEKVYPDDPARAVALTEHWYAAGDGFKTAYYARLAGEQALVVGDFQQAQTLLGWGLVLLPDDDAFIQKAELLVWIGALHWRLSDYEKAVQFYVQALAMAQKGGSHSLIAEALNGMGFVYCLMRDYDLAEKYSLQALDTAQTIADYRNSARALSNLGIVAESREDFAAARTNYDRALGIFRDIDDQRGAASTLNNLGMTADTQGDYESAQQYYAEALAIFEDIGYRHGIATACNNLGILYERQGDYDRAWDYYQRCLPLSHLIGDRRGSVNSLSNLVFTALEIGRVTEARLYLRDAIVIARDIGMTYIRPHLLAGAAQIYLHSDQLERAAELAGVIAGLSDLDFDFKTIRFEPLQWALREHLPAEVRSAAFARGAALDPDAVMDRILEDMQSGKRRLL